MRSREYYIVNHMMESYSAAFHTKRHMRHSRQLTMVQAYLTNQDPNSRTDSEDLVIIG